MNRIGLLLCLLFTVFVNVTAAQPQPLNVLLITLDTTRADHIGCYGYKKAQTPTIDRLAAGGARFATAFSSVPITLPSHATMLTGLYPFRTRVRDNGLDKLADTTATLANVLRSHSYHTFAYVSAAVLDRTFGLNRGFDVYDDNVRVGRPDAFRYEERAASQVTEAVIDDLGKVKPPYLLWVHYYDPHLPYVPPSPFDRRFADSPYDGEIAFVDSQLGHLLDALRAKKLLDNTLIIIAGDHGEALGDHGEKTHGVFIYDALLHVPLIFNCPGRVAPKVVQGTSRLIDIFPTVLDYAGIPLPSTPPLDGESLKQAILKGQTSINEAYEESMLPANSFGWSPLFAIRTGRWHLIDAPEKELYRVLEDPRELTNVYDKYPAQVAALQKKLVPWKKAATEAIQAAPSAQISPELQESLQALGYVSAGRKAVANGMDPKRGVPIMNQIDQARELLGAGDYDKGTALLEDVIRKNPGNVAARTSLGGAYLKHGKYAEAQAQFDASLKIGPPADFLLVNMGESLAGQKKYADARKQYEAAIALNPHFAQAYGSWTQMEIDTENPGEATKVLDRAIANGVQDPFLFLVRGRLAASAKDMDAAVDYFQRAARQNPEMTEAYRELGRALYQLKRIDPAITAYEKALQLQPDNVETLKTLGSLYLFERNDGSRALVLYEKALQLAPNARDADNLRELIQELKQ